MYYEFGQLDKRVSLKTRNPCPQLAPFMKRNNYITNTNHTVVGNYTENTGIL